MKKTTKHAPSRKAAQVVSQSLPFRAASAPEDALDLAWIDFFDTNPYGDLYRMWLVNPAVIQISLATARRKNGVAAFPSIDLGLAVQRQSLGDPKQWVRPEKLREWHDQLVASIGSWRPLKDLRVLDLGCGVGYLVKLLVPLGATYCGLDRSAKLVEHAKARWDAAGNGKAEYRQFYLASLPDDPKEAAAQLKTACGNEVPDIVLGVNVLEYLPRPSLLLNALRHLQSEKHATASAFFVTLNPDYYRRFSGSLGASHPRFSEPDKIAIVCLNRVVPSDACRLLGRFQVSELLRDSGYVTLQEAFMTVPPEGDEQIRNEYKEESWQEVNLGLAPFVGFVATPLPAGRHPSAQEWDSICGEDSVLRYLKKGDSPSRNEELLERIKADGILVLLNADQRLLGRHNLGGCLFIVVNGAFHDPHSPESVFRPHDLFGELEADHDLKPAQVRYGCYINDVVAAVHDSSVFEIPTPLATALVGHGNSLRAELFANLREKVLLRNARLTLRLRSGEEIKPEHKWERLAEAKAECPLANGAENFFFPKPVTNPFGSISNFSVHGLGRVAGALLELQEIEHRRRARCAWAHCVFVRSKDLGKMINDISEDEAIDYIRALCWLGAIDAFVLSGPSVKQECESVFSGGGSTDNRDLLKSMKSALWHSSSPRFIVIRDLPFLRSLAYDPLPMMEDVLFSRIGSLYGVRSSVSQLAQLTHEATGGRRTYFVTALNEFVAVATKAKGGICYSTGVAARSSSNSRPPMVQANRVSGA